MKRQTVRREDRAGLVAGRAGVRNGTRLPGKMERTLRHADLTAVAGVRAELRQLLRQWGEPVDADIAELLISELVTNALVHTNGGAVVTATVTDRLRVEVRDFVGRRPRLRPPTTDGTSGRGLMLVHSLADAWGVKAHGVGKCVWFELGGGPA
ncbi:ATP-binding protein [Streptomyces sp. NPDC059788]|uniref:ATP-binding protein n=1 Tax=Streptomyces sp. NPDC059788 TaxID=3346948 RepID=UPI003657EB19